MPDPRLEANKQTVLAFYQSAINNKDFTAASALVHPTYTQHNPRISDGHDGLREFITTLATDFPHLHADVRRLFADHDHVIAHTHAVRVPGGPATAIIDIFRLDNGLITEHWDVMQQIPDTSRNPNGMI
jgi:predicted SnoaL-like aldol condensation-catalyzing enzyme